MLGDPEKQRLQGQAPGLQEESLGWQRPHAASSPSTIGLLCTLYACPIQEHDTPVLSPLMPTAKHRAWYVVGTGQRMINQSHCSVQMCLLVLRQLASGLCSRWAGCLTLSVHPLGASYHHP